MNRLKKKGGYSGRGVWTRITESERMICMFDTKSSARTDVAEALAG